MTINLDGHATKGKMRVAGNPGTIHDIDSDGRRWIVGWFRLDSGGDTIWHKNRYRDRWSALTDVTQVIEWVREDGE